jgi:hypothetical protein
MKQSSEHDWHLNSIKSLYNDVMKCVGRKPKNEKRKGGINVHTVINVDETDPKFIWFTHSATYDRFSRFMMFSACYTKCCTNFTNLKIIML